MSTHADLNTRICAADDCNDPFDPVLPEQMYCTERCAARIRMRRYRARHKIKPNGGGPGGRRQSRLFPKSAMHRAGKPAKSVAKPKQDGLFPDDGPQLYASFGGAAAYSQDGSLSDNARYNKYSVKSDRRNSSLVSSIPEAPLAA
jgi:hypothetical protein